MTLETCNLWDIWSEWWRDMIWLKKDLPTNIPPHLPTYRVSLKKGQWQRQIQRQRQWQRQIQLEIIFKERSQRLVTFETFCQSLLFGYVMLPHHSDQMSLRSQVSRLPLWRCSLNLFVIVFFFVFVFVIVDFLVRSCLLVILIKCLKGQKSLGLPFEGAL